MYREVQSGIKPINILFDNGGLGDNIARLPAVKYIWEHHKHLKIYLWVHTYFKAFAINALRDTNVIIHSLDEKEYFRDITGKSFAQNTHSNLAYHLTEHAFNILVNKSVDPIYMNYLSLDLSNLEVLYNKPYVVVTTGYTADVREFYPSTINAIVDYIKTKGFDVVFLGQKTTTTGTKHIIKGSFNNEIDFSKGYDLIDKTDLLQAAQVINHSKAIIGLDNGLLHLAGCTEVPIVGGFSTVEPIYRMPYRHNVLGWNYYPIVPPESLKCRFCQSNWTFTYNLDFKTCYYDDFQCLKEMSANLYIEQLERIL